MGSANLNGPFRLSFEGISLAVRENTPGVFALGSLDAQGRFCLSRVGRSDDDLQCELRNLIGSETLFKFAHTRDAEEAFLKECELFHKFRPQSNILHPMRPIDSHATCPICEGHVPAGRHPRQQRRPQYAR